MNLIREIKTENELHQEYEYDSFHELESHRNELTSSHFHIRAMEYQPKNKKYYLQVYQR